MSEVWGEEMWGRNVGSEGGVGGLQEAGGVLGGEGVWGIVVVCFLAQTWHQLPNPTCTGAHCACRVLAVQLLLGAKGLWRGEED